MYETSVIQLLRPLLDIEGFPSQMIEDRILTHAKNGLSLLDGQCHSKYTCRYQCVLQMFSILHLADVIARFFPGGSEGNFGPDAIQLGMTALSHSKFVFPVARPLHELLRKTAVKLSIRLPAKSAEPDNIQQSAQKVYSMDDFVGACTRLSYSQPIHEIRQRYSKSLSADWVAYGPSFGFLQPAAGTRSLRIPTAEERGAQSLMQISNLLNG